MTTLDDMLQDRRWDSQTGHLKPGSHVERSRKHIEIRTRKMMSIARWRTKSTPEAWNEYFHLAFALHLFTRVKCTRKRKCERKKIKKIPFLAHALVFASRV